MEIYLSNSGQEPIYAQITRQIKQQIFFYLLRQLLWRTTLTAAAAPFDGKAFRPFLQIDSLP